MNRVFEVAESDPDRLRLEKEEEEDLRAAFNSLWFEATTPWAVVVWIVGPAIAGFILMHPFEFGAIVKKHFSKKNTNERETTSTTDEGYVVEARRGLVDRSAETG